MKKTLLILSVMAGLLFPPLSQANQSSQQLASCFTDSLNGRERKELAKWIFVAISTHSTLEPYANISTADRDSTDQFTANLITRLMTQDCPNQVKFAMKQHGSAALVDAFKLVGEVAMQELMNDANVNRSISGFERYLDEDKFKQIFQ